MVFLHSFLSIEFRLVQCNNNQDAMNYCQGILGCQGQDCDGGLVECLTCPSTPAVKFQRSDYSGKNLRFVIGLPHRFVIIRFEKNQDTVRFVVVLPLS